MPHVHLTNSQMCVDRCVACCARQVLVLPVRDVLVCAGITVLFSQAKVYDVNQVSLLAKPHQEVVRLHIPMDEILGVDVLNTTNLKRMCDTKRGKTVKLSSCTV